MNDEERLKQSRLFSETYHNLVNKELKRKTLKALKEFRKEADSDG